MQTSLADFIRDTQAGLEADSILRSCVHCGFCTATCPTYQLLGDELDGPRGRIYQIKQVLEGDKATKTLQKHLDRCLTCRSCETTCPSGVNYHRLLDIGRNVVEQQVGRSFRQQIIRKGLVQLLAYRSRITPLIKTAQWLRPALPTAIKKHVPVAKTLAQVKTTSSKPRQVLMLKGCVQSALAPEINQAAKNIFARLNIQVEEIEQDTCCGALPHHLNDEQRSQAMARQNIDAWQTKIEEGYDAIIVTASGCGAHIKDYGHILGEDNAYAEKAAVVSKLSCDPVELLLKQDLEQLKSIVSPTRIAVHTPCTLQHALGLNGSVEKLLNKLGYSLCDVAEGHLCCGSAGTYSILQPEISQQLRQQKIEALTQNSPDQIVTANIGCLTHLQESKGTPIEHWLTLVEKDLS